MKKVNRGFLTYFFIFLGILLAAFLICVVILIFSPGTSIFGLKYFKQDVSVDYQDTDVYEYNSDISWLVENGSFNPTVVNYTLKNGKQGSYLFVDLTYQSGGSQVENTARFVEREEEKNVYLHSTKIELYSEGALINAPDESYTITDNRISFNSPGDYFIYYGEVLDRNYTRFYRVNEDLSYSYYEYDGTWITGADGRTNDEQQTITRIEVPGVYVLENGIFSPIATGDYILNGITSEGEQDTYKVVLTNHGQQVYKVVTEPTGITNFVIDGFADTSSIATLSDGKLTFISAGTYTLKAQTSSSTTTYRVEVGTDLTVTYYVNSEIPRYVSQVSNGGLTLKAGYYSYVTDTQLTDLDIETVKVVSNSHSVQVIRATPTDENSGYMRVFVDNKTTGFTTGDVVTSSTSIKYLRDTKTLEITANIPEGFWVTSNSSQIIVRLPNTSLENMLKDFNYDIDAGKGSVSIGDEYSQSNLTPSSLGIAGLNVKTTGSLGITSYVTFNTSNAELSTLGAINLEVGSASIATTIKASSVNIKSSGNLNLNPEGVAIESNGDVRIETTDSYSSYGDIKISDLASKLYLSNVYGQQKFASVEGDVEISQDSRNCDYSFENINGNITAGKAATENEEEVKINCNITIETLIGINDIHTTGTVTIG